MYRKRDSPALPLLTRPLVEILTKPMGYRLKLLLVLLTLWSVQGIAQTCSTVWVYKPYLSCGQGAGPDTSAPATYIGYRELPSAKLEGAQDEPGICRDLMAAFNNDPQNRAAGLAARLYLPDPVKREPYYPNGLKIHVKWTYWCAVTVEQFPIAQQASSACGSEERYSYFQGNKPQDNATCLSCDEYDKDEDISHMVSCLQNNINDVINTRAVELRDRDLRIVAKKVRALQKENCGKSIPGMGSLDTLTTFSDFAGVYTCPRR